MRQIPPLAPAFTYAELFPAGTVLAPRTSPEQMRWTGLNEFRINYATGAALPILGEMALICHRNVLTPAIRAFYHSAGIRLGGTHRLYSTHAEAMQLARQCQMHGSVLAYFYSLPEELVNGGRLATPAALYDWLNDKANIDRLCDAAHLPEHVLLDPGACAALAEVMPQQPVFVKACHPGVSGGGADVRFCPDEASRQSALEWLAGRPAGWTAVRVEEAVDVRESWCLNLAMSEPDGVRYLGAAAQLFSSPAAQSGSRIDPQNQPAAETIAIAIGIAEKAARLGFVGVAGFDMAETRDGKTLVFDLNFRPVACTAQVLMHESAASRIDAKISQSWSRQLPGALAPALAALEPFAGNGSFVPVYLYESTLATGDVSRINGILMARTQSEIDALLAAVDAAVDAATSSP